MENQQVAAPTSQVTVIEKPNMEILPSNMFGSKEGFELIQRQASMFSKSDLLPQQYKGNVANCVIALDMANRMGANPLMVMQNLSVIQGKPAWSSTFLIATINSCGKFSPLRYEDSERDGGSTRAWAYDKATGDKLYGVWVSLKMAEAEGWLSKNGSKWKTMPELMRRYRAASFFTKQYAPEVAMGLATVEEVYDVNNNPIDVTGQKKSKEAERIGYLITDAQTIAELLAIKPHLQEGTPEFEAYETKFSELSEKEM